MRPSWGRRRAGAASTTTQAARQFFGRLDGRNRWFRGRSAKALLLRQHAAEASGESEAARARDGQRVPVNWTPQVRGTAGVMLVAVRAVGVWLLNRFFTTRLTSNVLSCLPAPIAKSTRADSPTTAYC